jgi:ribosomal protein S18 acetylase RimI-like enzyme
LAAGLRYLRAEGLPEVWLEALASNTPAVSLYRSLGYTPVDLKLLLDRFL